MSRSPHSGVPQDLIEVLQCIGINIRSIREEKGILQKDLAHRAKLSITTVSDIENHQSRDIQLSTLSAIAGVLDVPILQLLQSSDVELTSKDQVRLLKASEDILRIARKLRSHD